MSNAINYFVFVKAISVRGQVRGMRLSLITNNLAPNIQGKVKLSFIGLADAACVCVDLGNGDHVSFPPVGGTKCDECRSYNVASRIIVMKSLTLPVLYTESRVYTITASVGDTTTSLNVLVTNPNCYPPSISLETPSIESPNAPAQIKVEDRLTIVALSNGTICPTLQSMVYKWILYKLHSETLERLSEINLPQEPSSTNLKIILPPKLLMPGSFEVNLVGILDGIVSYSGTSAFVSISEMAPVIRFMENGEDFISVSEDVEKLCLSPAKYSYNPNIQNPKPGEVGIGVT